MAEQEAGSGGGPAEERRRERAAWEGPPREEREPWEREALTRLLQEGLREQRRARRWSLLFRFLVLAYLFLLLFAVQERERGVVPPLVTRDHTAVVKLEGVLAAGQPASADTLVRSLEDAFAAQHAKGVILSIDSPGGSPVQAETVYQAIRRLRKEHPDKPLYAVVGDVAASGAYYVAAAADRIYCQPTSIVGSIGVRISGLAGFGFVEAMRKLGIERRLLTAGEHKGLLDPFSPLRQDELRHVQGVLESIHRRFIQAVKEGRGERLKGDEATLFSGLFWTGEQGLALGLVDGYGDLRQVARDVVHAEELVDYTRKPSPLERLVRRFGSSVGEGLARGLVALGWWAPPR